MPDVRLIDANALRKNLSSRYMNELYPDWRTLPELTKMRIEMLAKEFRFALDHAITIDAVPVVHGRWVHDDLGHTYCSKCHERLPFMHCYTEEPCSDYDEEWDEEIPETRYCPNCGAKMDGGADNG